MKITDINTKDIDLVWPLVAEYLHSAVQEANGEYDLQDIYDALQKNMMRLWVTYDDFGIVKAAAVCTINFFPHKKICFIMFTGGVNVDEWCTDQTLSAIESWAKENGASTMQVFGRKGWIKKLKPLGFKEKYWVLTKELLWSKH